MGSWKSVVAVMVAVVFAVGPAWAQSGTSPSGDKSAPGATSTTEKDKAGAAGTMEKGGAADKGDKGATGEMKAAKAGMNEQVKAAQEALKDKGHDPGPVDGVMGPKTQAALKDFQKAQGLKDTGRLDKETMAKLGVEAKPGAAASPKTESGAPSASPPAGKTEKSAEPKSEEPKKQ